MANFRIKQFGEKHDNENLPRQGIVNDVCREWLLHEDKALAHRLQDEEYQNHLGSNKERNALLRQDTPRAREEQLREDAKAAGAQNAVELAMAQQEARDASIAYAIASELDRIEIEKKRQQELEDRLLAKTLMDKEKKMSRQNKEIRSKHEQNAGNSNRGGDVAPAACSSSRQRTLQDLSDLSDFCLKPTSSMDEEEMRRHQEGQDEELAKLVQEQDTKRRGDLLKEDQLNAIEVQDRELAKILQEQEKAKSKKAREKARQKALMKRRDSDERASQIRKTEETSRKDKSIEEEPINHYETPQCDLALPDPIVQRPGSPHYATPSFKSPSSSSQPSVSPQQRTTPPSGENYRNLQPSRRQTPPLDSKVSKKDDSGERRRSTSSKERTPPNKRSMTYEPASPSYTNIACAIDPTYQRRVMQGELSCQPPVLPPTPPHPLPNQNVPPVAPPPSQTKPSHVNLSYSSSSYENEEVEEDDYLPPPYMPIQGQRRLTYPDKKFTGTKSPKEKPAKDSSCKQQ